jgi:hypothetical protein
MNNDARLSHSFCEHAKTLAARKMCRAGNAVIRSASVHNVLVVDGVGYSLRQISGLITTPAEVRVSIYVLGTGWVDQGWMNADFFAKAALEI